jgi:hypothetical protein
MNIPKSRVVPSLRESGNILLTLTFVTLTFIVFRSDSLQDAFQYFARLFSLSIVSKPVIVNITAAFTALFFMVIMIVVEWVNRDKEHGLQIATLRSPSLRLAIYFALILSVIFLSAEDANQFIYFKF